MSRSLYIAAVLLIASASAQAADPEVALRIRNHVFTPAEVRVPAGQKIKLVVDNQDDTAEEFESHELNREKMIPPKSRANILIGPLKPGSYPFFGEFNAKTARGVIIAE